MDKREELKKYKLLLEEGIIEQSDYDKKIEELIMADSAKTEEINEVDEVPAAAENEAPSEKKGKNTKTIVIAVAVSATSSKSWVLSRVFQTKGTEVNIQDIDAKLQTKVGKATITVDGVKRTLEWTSTIPDSSILGLYGEMATGVTDTKEGMVVKFVEHDGGYDYCIVSGFDDKMYIFRH